MDIESQVQKLVGIVEEHEKRLLGIEKLLGSTASLAPSALTGDSVSQNAELGKEKLAKKVQRTTEEIDMLFEIDGDSSTITKLPSGNAKQITHKGTVAMLVGFKYLLKADTIPAKELKRIFASHRVPLENFATYLNEITPKWILRKGKTRSNKTTYKLTYAGEAEGFEVIKDLLNRGN